MLTPVRPPEYTSKSAFSTATLPSAQPAILESWGNFIHWLISLFTRGPTTVSTGSSLKGLSDPTVIKAFSDLVTVQQTLAELTKNPNDSQTDPQACKLLEQAFDAAMIINTSGECHVDIGYPGYVSESSDTEGARPITDKDDFLRTVSRNSDVCIAIKKKDNDTTIFAFNRRNAGLCRAIYEVVTFPDPTTEEQQRIRYHSIFYKFGVISRRTLPKSDI